MISIQIIYAPAAQTLWQRDLQIPAQLTIGEILEHSGIYKDFPELMGTLKGVGIFGLVKSLGDNVIDGDRVEVYRELNFDPMESRRRRAAHRKAGILKKKHLKADRSKRFEYIEHKDNQIRSREYE